RFAGHVRADAQIDEQRAIIIPIGPQCNQNESFNGIILMITDRYPGIAGPRGYECFARNSHAALLAVLKPRRVRWTPKRAQGNGTQGATALSRKGKRPPCPLVLQHPASSSLCRAASLRS